MSRRLLATLALAAFLGLSAPAPATACPSCKNAVAEDESGNASTAGAGYSYSIYFMIAVPYLMFTIAGTAGYRSFKSWEREQAALEELMLGAA